MNWQITDPFQIFRLCLKFYKSCLCSIVVLSAKKKDIYEEIQSGFRPHHSTETALVKITNDLLLASDQGCISLLVLAMSIVSNAELDLSAAFDTIDHDIFIDQMQNYTGIQGQALRWFRSGISNPAPEELPSCRLQFQPCCNTPVCNNEVALNTLISCFRCV